MTCGEHRNYNPNCDTCVRAEQITTAWSHAAADNQSVMAMLLKGYPHNAAQRAYLAKATESLNAYLAELER